MSVDEIERMLASTGPDLDELLDRAAALRDEGLAAAGRPGVFTYSRKVFVPLTTLCRDRCHYCVFVDTPNQLRTLRKPAFMSEEQVLSVVRQGQALGCKEVLLTLGDRPEERWPEARAWLDAHGFASTLDYVGHIARLVTRETGMLAHLNPGVMSHDELVSLRPTAPSMGMMLETTSRRLYEERGQVHFGSPDKDPAVRLGVIDDAGRAGIPFTTGILVGIGETLRDRAESLTAIRDLHARHGHVQEVIVQNFRAKGHTAMQDAPDADQLEYVAAVATARIVMGPHMRIQVPPNLSDPAELDLLVRAGADDWGGVSPLTADHVNPERPWPQLDDLAARTANAGFELRERLTAQPEFVRDAVRWLDPAMHEPVSRLADPASGLAAAQWGGWGAASDLGVRGAEAQRDQANRLNQAENPEIAPVLGDLPVFGDNEDAEDASAARIGSGRDAGGKPAGDTLTLAERAAADPLALDDAEWAALLTATGADLDALTAVADDVRRYTVGEAVSIVVNRNLTSTGLRAVPGSPAEFTLADAADIARDAVDLGATEICVQGRLSGTEDPTGYLALARGIRDAAPGIHLHAFRPQDVCDLADRTGVPVERALQQLKDAGVDTMPGTGVKVLAERVRGLVAPGDLEIDRWTDTILSVHRAGFSTTSVLFYGHVETAAERIAHLRELRRIQSMTGGFREFVPIPLPGPAGGVALVPGREPIDEHRAMVAVSRLLLSGSIAHVQIPWTRVGRDAASVLLRAGGDDLGGTLLDGRVKPEAGIEHGLELPVADAERIAAHLRRPFRVRTTDYRNAAPGEQTRFVSLRSLDDRWSMSGDTRGAPETTRSARVEVLVVGAGFAGIGAAMALRRAGVDDLLVIERAASLGGTWRDNTYPGVACDVPSHLYGFSAHPNPDWSHVFARGGEIRGYLESVAEAEGIRPVFGTALLGAAWDDASETWRVRTGGPALDEIEADILVLACGRLTEPSIPALTGLESFPGPLFHSSRWDDAAPLAGTRVAVVGTGASAIQLTPALAEIADVTLFQRTPAWIVPRGDRAYSAAEQTAFAADPLLLEELRDDLYLEGEARHASRSGDARAAAEARAVALAHLEAQVPDAALRRALTPDYAFGCKRVLLSDDFYPALASGRVRLEASALASVHGSTLVAASGAEHEVDALVLATGFASTRQPYAELVTGERDTLAEHWRRGMTAYASTVVSGFPNLFVLDGPNAALGHNSSVLMLEEQAAYLARTVVSRSGPLRVDPDAEAEWTAEIDRAAASTPWITGGCRNWYVDDRSGRLTLLWPGTVDAFRQRLRGADGSEFLSPMREGT